MNEQGGSISENHSGQPARLLRRRQHGDREPGTGASRRSARRSTSTTRSSTPAGGGAVPQARRGVRGSGGGSAAGGDVACTAPTASPRPSARRRRKRNLRAIDATCPLVTKVHLEAVRFAREGYTILFNRPCGPRRGAGYDGEAPEHIRLVAGRGRSGAAGPAGGGPPAYLTQTTLSVDDADVIIAALKRRFPQIVGPSRDDICYRHAEPSGAVKELVPDADAVIVLGSQNSSNSRRLAELANASGRPAYLVDGIGEDTGGQFSPAAKRCSFTAGPAPRKRWWRSAFGRCANATGRRSRRAGARGARQLPAAARAAAWCPPTAGLKLHGREAESWRLPSRSGRTNHDRSMSLEEFEGGDLRRRFSLRTHRREVVGVSPQPDLRKPGRGVDQRQAQAVRASGGRRSSTSSAAKARRVLARRETTTPGARTKRLTTNFPLHLPKRQVRWRTSAPFSWWKSCTATTRTRTSCARRPLFPGPFHKEYWVIDARDDADRPSLRVHQRYGRRLARHRPRVR